MSLEIGSVGIILADNDAVLVKFHFNNPRMIPQGLRAIDRKSERELLEKRQRERVGRGYEILKNIQKTQVALLRKGLAANSLRLVDAHVYENRKPGKTTKHVVVLSFRRISEIEEVYEVPTEGLEALRALSIQAVWTCHVWQNPNRVAVVELVQRQPEVVPCHALVTRSGKIVAEPTERYYEEEEEVRERGLEILKSLSG